jgi:hypothetical protein
MKLYSVSEGVPTELNSFLNYSIYSDGIYLTKKIAGGGTLTFKVDGIPGLGNGKESIKFLTRPIPISAFWIIVRFFRFVTTHFNETLEAYAVIGYSNDEDKYCVWVPKQTVGGASVNYDISELKNVYPGYHIVLDLHAHPWKGSVANFSGVDNKNDINDRFSGVVGDVMSLIPQHKFRFGANGKFWEYSIDQLFADTNEVFEIDFNEAVKNISLTKTQQGCIIKESFAGARSNMHGKPSWFEEYVRNKNKSGEFTVQDLLGKDW